MGVLTGAFVILLPLLFKTFTRHSLTSKCSPRSLDRLRAIYFIVRGMHIDGIYALQTIIFLLVKVDETGLTGQRETCESQ